MAIYVDKNRKIKNIFVNVNGEKKSISSVWVNSGGVPTKVFQSNNKSNSSESDSYEIAPENEYNNWDYTLDDTNNIITLNRHIISGTDVIVYANYEINGKIYKTKLANFGENGTKIYNTFYMYMFGTDTKVESIRFSENIDTSNLKEIDGMFSKCSNVTNIDLSNFDTSNVIDMSNLFYGCTRLTSLDLSEFDTHNVKDMYGMFRNCKNLKTVYITKEKWMTLQANKQMMFENCGASYVYK